MKLFYVFFPASLLIFAFSVCMVMASLSLNEEEILIFGLKPVYYTLPLFFFSIYAILLNVFNSGKSSNLMLNAVLGFSIMALCMTCIHLNSLAQIFQVLLWPTSFLATYYSVRRKPEYAKILLWTFVLIFVFGLITFIYVKMIQTSFSGFGLELRSNSVFCVVSTLPFLLLFRSVIIKYFGVVITLIVVLFSNKRSVSLIFALAIIPTIWSSISNIKSRIKKIFLITIIVVGLIFIYLYIIDNYLGNLLVERFSNIEDDGGSGRDQIWATIIDKINRSDVLLVLFGHGHNTVREIVDFPAAHNDFLDVIYDYGFITLIFYLYFHLTLLKNTCIYLKQDYVFAASYYFEYVTFVIMSFVSILLMQQRYLIYMAVFWALVEAIKDNNNENKIY